jgi:succinoglycan biosynthesis transport protein ExoP
MKIFENLSSFFDIGDIKYFYLVAKKNIKNLVLLSFLVSLLVYFVYLLNLTKKYLSNATLVIAPDENKIVNIEEVYSLESIQNRVNNQIAILKSEEVIDYVVEDNKNELEFKNLYSTIEKVF